MQVTHGRRKDKDLGGLQSLKGGSPHFSGCKSSRELITSSAEVQRWDCFGREGTATTSIPAALPAVTPGLKNPDTEIFKKEMQRKVTLARKPHTSSNYNCQSGSCEQNQQPNLSVAKHNFVGLIVATLEPNKTIYQNNFLCRSL